MPALLTRISDRPDLRLDPVDAGGDRVAVGHVEGGDLGFMALRLEFGRRAGELGGIASVQHDARAVGREALREREADALARSGDQRDPAAKVEVTG